MKTKLNLDDKVESIVDKERRLNIEANHSTVHILQLALQTLIAKDIYQVGSKVTDTYLRFDFNYHGKITDETLVKVENFVNDYIKNSYKRETTIKNVVAYARVSTFVITPHLSHLKITEITV